MRNQEKTSKSAAPFALAGLGAAPFAGTWAFRLDVPIVWSNMAVGSAVKGIVRAVGRVARLATDENVYSETFTLCALQFPEWQHRWNNQGRTFKHRLVLSETLFDSGYLPPSPRSTVEQVIHGANAGRLLSGTVALLGGIRTDDPVATPWCRTPSLEHWTDSDDDFNGLPGITGVFDQRDGFAPVAADMFGSTQVSQVGIGFRLRFSYEAQPLTLDKHEGVAMPITSDWWSSETQHVWPDVRVLWAQVATPSKGTIEAAKPHQLNFLNRFLNPHPDVEVPATIKFQRIVEGTTCARIREVML